ncbi:MAG: S49 family peptidase [Pyrobaculum sp.]
MASVWVKAGVAAALAISLVALFMTLSTWYIKPAPPAPKIVVAPVDFVIASPYAGELVRKLTEIAQREEVAGLILLVNSPGGTVADTEALYTALLGINKTKYAVVTGMAASGAYYISVATDKIYATPSSWVGSIGVIAVLWPETYFYDVPDYIYTTGPLKYYGKELTDYYNDVEKIRLNFVAAVLKGRGEKIKDLAALETAAVFTAGEALQLGLVDEIGGLFDAVRDMAMRLGLRQYEVVYLNSTTGGVDLGRLLNQPSPPIFYILPTAVQWTLESNTPRPQLPPVDTAGKPYVVFDMAHGNMVPNSFIEVLRAELAARGHVLTPVETEYGLARALQNATGLVVVNPTTPFSKTAVEAVVNATRRGVRVVYFYDMRASAVVYIGGVGYIAPYSAYAPFDPLLMYFNMSGLRAVYNYTGGAKAFEENWQLVTITPNGSWRLLRNVSRLVFFSPSAVSTNAPYRLEAAGYMFGYGHGVYTVAAQAGNFTFVGSVRSFTPYFITMGDNWQFFKNLVGWLTEPRKRGN